MTNEAHHWTNQIHPVPRGSKDMHLPELYNPVDAMTSRDLRQLLFSL